MESLLKQLSAYDLVNAFVPGVMLAALADWLGVFHLLNQNMLVLIVASYLAGVVASRIGSLVIEPIMLRAGFIVRESYADYISAARDDEGIPTLMAVASMYRSLLGGCVLAALIAAFSALPEDCKLAAAVVCACAVVALIALSWCKQEGYVAKRIRAWKEPQDVAD